MTQIGFSATFMRGGSSKGVFFRETDLPSDPDLRDLIFLAALGSPDPYERQLNGLGGGLSSVSKAVVIGPSTRPDADLDYTFAQVSVTDPVVDYASNCGNLSSAVGPFAIDAGLAEAGEDNAVIVIHNTNTGKLIRATVPVRDGAARTDGTFSIPGVAGAGAGIRLDFLEPAGTATGRLLPTGNPSDTLETEGDGVFEASMVDSSVPCVFLSADRFGLSGTESVDTLERNGDLMALMERLRRLAAVRMGLARTPGSAAASAPKIGLVAKPGAYRTLAGETVPPDHADIAARLWSMGRVHRVLPLTGAMCLAVACRIPGSVCARLMNPGSTTLRLANPSGVLPLDARVRPDRDGVKVEQVTAWRTARMLMKGQVFVPETTLAAEATLARAASA